MIPADFIGRRVVYRKDGHSTGRQGWTGTISKISAASLEVLWDQLGGDSQAYSLSALSCSIPDVKYFHDQFSYIHLLDESIDQTDRELYLVAGAIGGRPERFFGKSAALEYAQKRAADSKSGQKYLVFRAVTECQRQEQPVLTKDITNE